MQCLYLTSVTAVCTAKSTDQCVSVVFVSDQCNCCGTAKSTDQCVSVVSVSDQCNCCGTAKSIDQFVSVCLYLTSVTAVRTCAAKLTYQCVSSSVVFVSDQCNCCGTTKSADQCISVLCPYLTSVTVVCTAKSTDP